MMKETDTTEARARFSSIIFFIIIGFAFDKNREVYK